MDEDMSVGWLLLVAIKLRGGASKTVWLSSEQGRRGAVWHNEAIAGVRRRVEKRRRLRRMNEQEDDDGRLIAHGRR